MAMAPDPSKHDVGGPIDETGGIAFSSGVRRRPLTEGGPISAAHAANSEATLAFRGQGKPSIRDWGYPGFLSQDEYCVYEQFREEVRRRGKAFQSAVFSFEKANESECYALCRWLRARKFIFSDVIQMVEEAVSRRAAASGHDFFPDPHHALGVEACIYHSQYPQFYYGYAKGGFPLFISKAGSLNAAGLACVTTIEGILNFHWYDMMHDYVQQLRQQAKLNPAFKRYETVVIMDLNQLTSSQLTKRTLDIVKVQSEIDSLCFPETLHRLVIVNAPSFFAMTWKVIRNWVDERTANKVTILGTNRAKWVKKLRELVDEENLPENYGGKAESTESFVEKKTVSQYEEIAAAEKCGHNASGNTLTPAHLDGENITGHRVHLFSVRSNASHSVGLTSGESMRMSIFTKSLAGCTLNLLGPGKKKILSQGKRVRHFGEGADEENPTRVDLDVILRGPGRFKIKLESLSGPFSTDNFLFVGKVFTAGEKRRSHVTSKEIKTVTETGVGAPPLSCEDDSSEENILGDASSLCEQLCFSEGISKDSTVPESSFSGRPDNVSSPLKDHDPTEYNHPAAENLPPPVPRAQDQVDTEQRQKNIAKLAIKDATPVPVAVAVEPEQPPNIFMCGVLSAPSIREVFSRLWCASHSTKQ
mmetsp:Transcript_51203/g.153814  ORF Transcript_51203/g.153814 Transcript_51203/m.153814 type:complete len:645 (-) Transcript_51203:186-2120(-)